MFVISNFIVIWPTSTKPVGMNTEGQALDWSGRDHWQ